VVFSPKVRNVLHRAAVVGVSGVLVGADMILGFFRGLRTGVAGNGAAPNGRSSDEEIDEQRNGAPATRRRRRPATAGAS
jgi:hypothetical protein